MSLHLSHSKVPSSVVSRVKLATPAQVLGLYGAQALPLSGQVASPASCRYFSFRSDGWSPWQFPPVVLALSLLPIAGLCHIAPLQNKWPCNRHSAFGFSLHILLQPAHSGQHSLGWLHVFPFTSMRSSLFRQQYFLTIYPLAVSCYSAAWDLFAVISPVKVTEVLGSLLHCHLKSNSHQILMDVVFMCMCMPVSIVPFICMGFSV